MDTQKHISSAFDQDLRILNDALQQLGDLAYQQLEGAIEGLAMQNQANLDTVIKGDAALDALEPDSLAPREALDALYRLKAIGSQQGLLPGKKK